MAMMLGLLESLTLYAAICGAMFAWTSPGAVAAPVPLGPLMARGLALFLCCFASFYLHDLYDIRIVRSFESFSSRLPRALAVTTGFVALFYLAWPQDRPPMEMIVTVLLAVPGVMLPLRALSYRVMRSRPLTERVLFVGASSTATRLVPEIESRPIRSQVLGLCGDLEAHETTGFTRPWLGDLDRLTEIVEQLEPDRILVTMLERRGRMPVRALADIKLRGIAVEDGMELYERLTGRLPIESVSASTVIFHRDVWKPKLYHSAARAVSLMFAAVVLILVLPLLFLIGWLIKLDSAGPVLFVQRRTGRGGRAFDMFKFRTMRTQSEEISVWTRDDDERVTRVGRWLRKFRLDELPQLVNVLLGDMNLLGPRPHPYSNYDLYEEKIPHYWLRCAVRPGITGWAQVRHGYANGLEEEVEKMTYDLYYIKHASPLLDLRIVIETIKLILLGRDKGTSATSAIAALEDRPTSGGEQAA